MARSFVAAVHVEFLRLWRPSVWSSFVRGGRPCVVPCRKVTEYVSVAVGFKFTPRTSPVSCSL